MRSLGRERFVIDVWGKIEGGVIVVGRDIWGVGGGCVVRRG